MSVARDGLFSKTQPRVDGVEVSSGLALHKVMRAGEGNQRQSHKLARNKPSYKPVSNSVGPNLNNITPDRR